MKNHVVSLELAKKMKELGFPQRSEFYYSDTRKSWKKYNQVNGEFVPFNDDTEIELFYGHQKAKNASSIYNHSEPLSAYLATELGEWLPANLEIENEWVRPLIQPSRGGGHWIVYYGDGKLLQKYVKMSNSIAQMLIYLAKKGIINPKKL